MRGDVHYLSDSDMLEVVIVSNTDITLNLVTIVPLSPTALPASWRPTVRVEGIHMQALTDQITTVQRDNLGAKVTHLTPDEMGELNEALKIMQGLR